MPQIVDLSAMKMGVNYGCDKVRFPAPVKVGSRVRGRALLVSAEATKDGGVQAVIRVSVEIENGDKPGCVADTIARYYF
jgi:acyl dehydratase